MEASRKSIEAPLAPTGLTARWRDLCADATFEDVAAKIELTEWGEILMSPVGKTELCIEIVSVHNALPKLREKAMAYVRAGAHEAWLVYTDSRQVEIYGREGRSMTTGFGVEVDALFAGW